MSHAITFAPLVPLWLIAVVGGVGLALIGVALFRGGRGWSLRTLALAILVAALANPRIASEDVEHQRDLAIIVVDDSASQSVGDRRAAVEAARASIADVLARFEALDVEVVRVADEGRGDGTRLFAALEAALADEPASRLAGAVLITDGQIHDSPADGSVALAAPVHVLFTGAQGERDRRLLVEQAPAYGLVGKAVNIVYRIDDAPGGEIATVRVRVDGAPADELQAAVGRPQTHTLVLDHGGPTVVELEVEPAPGDLSAANNRAVITVNGVRDRLRVLLVSGQPHAGERTWRNLLKSDPSVDLVHFTILRPPEKDDMTPLRELSLIVFPVQELFQEKLHEFDLIVFDRYIVRDVLPSLYLRGIGDYLRDGGAILLATGPEFAGPRSLFLTPLGEIMPGVPTGRVLQGAYRPGITETGHRHPVTSALPGDAVSGAGEAGPPTWGRWYRTIEADLRSGSALMTGYAGKPLLIIDRVGDGRIAQVMSDQIWLWARGYDGGGPHAELVRRLAHWLMKEPELEEEAITARVEDGQLLIERRSLSAEPVEALVTRPDGSTETVVLEPGADGVARTEIEAAGAGLYRIDDGERTALAASGTVNPLEHADLRATAERLAPVAEATGGGVAWLADDLPEFRRIRPGRDTTGRGWLGLRRNEVTLVTGVAEVPLIPALVVLALVVGGLAGAWWREGR